MSRVSVEIKQGEPTMAGIPKSCVLALVLGAATLTLGTVLAANDIRPLSDQEAQGLVRARATGTQWRKTRHSMTKNVRQKTLVQRTMTADSDLTKCAIWNTTVVTPSRGAAKGASIRT